MKKFETPQIEVEKFELMDVITTSTDDCSPDCKTQLECLGDG